jgi:hypothetical protein
MMLKETMETQRVMPLKAARRRDLVARADVRAQAVEERARRMGLEVEVGEEGHRLMGLQRVVDNLRLRLRLRLRRADISSDLSMGRYVGFRISL